MSSFSATMSSKKQKLNPSSKWSNLDPNLLNLILSKTSLLNIINFKYVCSSWYSYANSGLLSYNFKKNIPFLMFPSDEKDGSSRLTFSSPGHNSTYQPHNGCQELGDGGLCIGSSRGWLAMLNEKLDQPYLFNPFSLFTIQLPLITTFSNIDKIEIIGESICFDAFDPEWNHAIGFGFESKQKFIESKTISKVDFCSCDDTENEFVVAMIIDFNRYFNHGVELAFCRSKDAMWYRLPVIEYHYKDYRDVICYSDKLYILNGYSIEIWDIIIGCNLPIKKQVIEAYYPPDGITKLKQGPFRYCDLQSMLVELHSGDFLLVEKVNFVRNYQESGWTYNGLPFVVSKMDVTLKKWVEVESIGNNVVFLGAKMSRYSTVTSSNVEGFKRGCIYFTCYGYNYAYSNLSECDCHVGVYNIEDKRVEPYHSCELFSKAEPFWIVPEVSLGETEWIPPEENVLKFNVSGYFDKTTCMAGCGGVVRNAFGHILGLFSIPSNALNVNFAALKGIYQAIEIWINGGWQGKFKLEIECDANLPIKWITNTSTRPWHLWTDLNAIDKLIGDIRYIQIQLVHKKANRIAKALAKQGAARSVPLKAWWSQD